MSPPLLTRALRCGLGFLAGAVAMAAAIAPWAPELLAPGAAEKLRWLAAHGDDYDVLFVGSSRIHHQLIPELFDRLMAAGGVPVRSFNLALDGLRPPEDAFLIERALRGRRAPLRWVIVEACEIRFSVEENNQKTQRIVYWHDWPRLGWLTRRYLLGSGTARGRWWRRPGQLAREAGDFLTHGRLAAVKGLHLGQGAELVRTAAGLPPLNAPRIVPAGWDGFQRASGGSMPAKMAADYARKVAALQRDPPRADFRDATSQALVQWTRERVAAAGGDLLLLVPPTVQSLKFFPDPARTPTPPCLDFHDPARYPQLFLPEHRKDTVHLNHAGAELLTQLVAERLLQKASARLPR